MVGGTQGALLSPQVMKVKLQPPSGTELPAFNPIVHPSAITQVLLLANPQKVTPAPLGLISLLR